MQDSTNPHADISLRALIREHRRSFLVTTAAAIALRLFLILRFPVLTPDTFVYGDLAKNWLLHGVYGLSGTGGPSLTLIRLPGYPAFLAGLFAVFGMEHYNAVRFVQMFIELGTCLAVADTARRTVSGRAARLAFLLTALCLPVANYVAVPLTETLAVFLAALGLDFGISALQAMEGGRAALRTWICCGLAVGLGILVRPDGGMILMVIGGYLIVRLFTRPAQRGQTVAAGTVLGLVSLGMLLPWTIRNWRAFHVFQPLAPFSATDPGEFFPAGFVRWQQTWVADYASVEDIGFRVDGEPIQLSDLPNRALDNDDERRRTAGLFNEYNQNLTVTPAIDAGFAELARERIRRAPLRYYVWLPALRIADMWLRPRTELLPVDSHWWRFADDPHDSLIALALAAVNGFFLVVALLAWRRRRLIAYGGLLLAFILVRTLLLSALPNPEPRYVLECYPALLVLAAAGLEGWDKARSTATTQTAAAVKEEFSKG